MLCENDLICKIAEYRCKDTITESDCVKLAAFLTIRDCLFPEDNGDYNMYSMSSGNEDRRSVVEYDSDAEFFTIANGMECNKVWKIVGELMETLQIINPRLYAGVIKKLEEG